MGASKPITWNDKQYESMAAAAAVIGISREAMRRRIDRGQTCDSDLSKQGGNAKFETSLTE